MYHTSQKDVIFIQFTMCKTGLFEQHTRLTHLTGHEHEQSELHGARLL